MPRPFWLGVCSKAGKGKSVVTVIFTIQNPGLEATEKDLLRRTHLENDLLFPLRRAARFEQRVIFGY